MVRNRQKPKGRSKDELKAERRARVRSFLTAWGMWQLLRKTKFAEQILDSYCPRPTVAVGESVRNPGGLNAVLGQLRRTLADAHAGFPGLGDDVPFIDLMSLALPTAASIRTGIRQVPAFAKLLADRQKRLPEDDIAASVRHAVAKVYCEMDNVLAQFGRIDSGLYRLTVNFNGSGQMPSVSFELNWERARVRHIPVGGQARLAYWCGRSTVDGLKWIQWPRTIFGGSSDEPLLPVFVQGHALDHLYRRDDTARLKFATNSTWYIHDRLAWSLLDPVVSAMSASPGKVLAEYRAFGHKLGYLVVSQVGDVALVETFLFLTMDGTPEGEVLWRELALKRSDKEYLGLDRIQTFRETDVREDRELVALLEKCGCGHLCRVLDGAPSNDYRKGYADEVRKYLNLRLRNETVC